MSYLISKLLVWLILAFLFGIVMGLFSNVGQGKRS
jgi:uncharacterized protein YneF (UPF0154 family)